MMQKIQVTQYSLPDFEVFSKEIQSLWQSRWLTNTGEKHQMLQRALEQYLYVPHVELFSNGHLALEYAIEALELTGELITSPFTFASTTHAIVRKGLTPVFADIDPVHYTMQTDHLERLITERTTAIVPVHVYGNICDVEAIEALAEKYRLKVIYDAAHAFGVTINGTSVANFGDVSMFSFHATKVFHTIEGGALTLKNEELAQKLKLAKNFGIASSESVDYVGGNAKMNEIQAIMGLCNLQIIEGEIAKRKRIYTRYMENLADVKGLKLPFLQAGVESNYAYFPVVFDGFSRTRDEVYE